MDRIKVIAFTHRTVRLDDIGRFHVSDENLEARLTALKDAVQAEELMFLSTCNRVEFVLVNDNGLTEEKQFEFFSAFNQEWSAEQVSWAVKHGEVFEGKAAVEHMFKVAASLDSLVVGEREIITQVRNSFESSTKLGLTGSSINLLVRKTVETAKRVYTETHISRNPVSVVSLAFKKLERLNVSRDAKILVIGSGQTNYAMTNFMQKAGYQNFTVFNRTVENATKLATKLEGNAHPLSELEAYQEGFDVLITCTGAEEAIFTKDLYSNILQNDAEKVVVDLAIPADFDTTITESHNIKLVDIPQIKKEAAVNLEARRKEIGKCEAIIAEQYDIFEGLFRERQVEIAMREVPLAIKEIKQKVVDEVFAKDLDTWDEESKETLDKILAYVEKKYISVPMKMAKEIMTKQ